MTPAEAMQKINVLLAHAWMVRTFLKHADEVQEDEELLEVPRMIFDYCRAVEGAFARNDPAEYVHRARGKLSKLKKVAEYFAANHKRVSDHTNFQMAAVSLTGVVQQVGAILAEVPRGSTGPADQGSDPGAQPSGSDS